MNKTMKAPAGFEGPTRKLFLADGSSVDIDENGYASIPSESISTLLNSGWTLIQSDISEDPGE